MKACEICEVELIKKHAGAKTCSRSCGSKLREKNRVIPESTRYDTQTKLVRTINKFLLAMPV